MRAGGGAGGASRREPCVPRDFPETGGPPADGRLPPLPPFPTAPAPWQRAGRKGGGAMLAAAVHVTSRLTVGGVVGCGGRVWANGPRPPRPAGRAQNVLREGRATPRQLLTRVPHSRGRQKWREQTGVAAEVEQTTTILVKRPTVAFRSFPVHVQYYIPHP